MVVDIRTVFKNCSINPEGSINRNIQNVSSYISDSTNPHARANDIIKKLGGTHCLDSHEAAIIAKVMIQQAIQDIQQKREFDPAQAMQVAKVKVADMKENHPYLFAMKENTVTASTTTTTTPNASSANDKKARALEIFEANRGKKPSDVAKLIQVELGITFANAYYYVSRVFK